VYVSSNFLLNFISQKNNDTVYNPQQYISLFTAQIYKVFDEENLEDTFQLINIETGWGKKFEGILNQ
jgi:hypothetical protein